MPTGMGLSLGKPWEAEGRKPAIIALGGGVPVKLRSLEPLGSSSPCDALVGSDVEGTG